MEPATAGQNRDEATRAAGEKRIFRRVLRWGLAAFLVVLVGVPTNLNPILRLFVIPSSSMAPTLSVGSYVVANRLSYGLSRFSYDWITLPIQGRVPFAMPTRGDVVVYRLPRDPKVTFVGRVIGLPGDRIQMIQGRLVLNGATVSREPAADFPHPTAAVKDGKSPAVASFTERLAAGQSHRIIEAEGDTGLLDSTGEFRVPTGHLSMMGDNRDNSNDSRVPPARAGVGYVPVELVVGKIVYKF